MIDFEYAFEREDIERPELLDPGVGLDPATAEGVDQGAIVTDGTPAGAEPTTDGLAADAFGFAGIDFLPGAGFDFEFGFFFG